MLQELRSEYGIRSVACEGGATLFPRPCSAADLVDQLNLTIAPLLFGGAKGTTLTGLKRGNFFPSSIKCSLTDMRMVGE